MIPLDQGRDPDHLIHGGGMIIVYGTRLFGKIDVCDGGYAATRFAHIYWMPIIPVSETTIWVTANHGEQSRGHDMRIAWKSIAAAYLRTWGFVIGLALSIPAINELGHRGWSVLDRLLFGVLLLGASLYSWRWYRVSATERERRALCAAVTGTHCAPEDLPDEIASPLRQGIERTWAERFPAQTPGDIARFGPQDPAQALLAYLLLRLHARDVSRAQARELRALAEQVAQNTPWDKLASDGVYRPLVQMGIGTDAKP